MCINIFTLQSEQREMIKLTGASGGVGFVEISITSKRPRDAVAILNYTLT